MIHLPKSRLSELLDALSRIASGDLSQRVPISPAHDEMDAIGHAINVMVGELQILTEGLRHAKEEAEAASQAKTTFLRNVSHEIRTPLTVILGTAELMAAEKSRQRVRELYQRLTANGKALTGILDDLLDLSKVEAEKVDFDLHSIDIVELVADVVASFEAEVTHKKLSILIDAEGDDPPPAFVDQKRLRQILTNLIGNAIKFTAQGYITVRLGHSTNGRKVVIDVSDTGIGLTEEQISRLFQPFVQADKTISGNYGGSGLGLVLSKRLAEGMGGSLRVLKSEPGVGTTFRLTLPVADKKLSVSHLATARAQRGESELRGQVLLIADDNKDVRLMFAEFLRSQGATVVEAADGQEAIERALEMPFDYILMDVRMPKVDGLEATRQLRAKGIESPIIALTADAVFAQKKECFAAGCTAYLAKPIDLPELIVQLAKHSLAREA